MQRQQLGLMAIAIVVAAAVGGIGGRCFQSPVLNSWSADDAAISAAAMNLTLRQPGSPRPQPLLPDLSANTEPLETATQPDVVFFPESITSIPPGHSDNLDVTAEQRTIWQTSLSDLPPEQAHEIQQLRTRLGSIAAQSLGLTSLTPSEPEPQLIDIPKDGSLQRAVVRSPASPHEVRNAIEQVAAESRSQIAVTERVQQLQRANHEQRLLPGFKRSEIFLIHRAATEDASVESLLLTSIWSERVDLAPGKLRATGNPFDLAIDGPGWLNVESADGLPPTLTRNGQLTLAPDRRLAVRTPRGVLPLSPSIKLPEDAGRFELSPDGRCVTWPRQAELAIASVSHECGQLLVANCLDPSLLKALGDGLYQPTDASGPIWQGVPGTRGLGTLKSQTLEVSNDSE